MYTRRAQNPPVSLFSQGNTESFRSRDSRFRVLSDPSSYELDEDSRRGQYPSLSVTTCQRRGGSLASAVGSREDTCSFTGSRFSAELLPKPRYIPPFLRNGEKRKPAALTKLGSSALGG